MSRILDARAPEFPNAYARLIAARGGRLEAAEAAVAPILADVRARGIEAVLDYAERFDGVRLTVDALRVAPAELDAAVEACPPDLIQALELAAERIAAFHALEKPQDGRLTDAAGVTLGWRWTPVDACGLYAPGGKAAYPSSVLMNAVPAKAAGVARIVLCTPPGRASENPAILAAARIAGVTEVWRIGGAQAIAAMAYGAGPLAPVDVIAGPGNAYVTAAKKRVFGDVGIDSIAGPSEVFVIADATVDPRWLAADLLAQAEHDEDAQSVLFVADEAHGRAVLGAVEAMLAAGEAGAPARASWTAHGAVILVPRLADAVPLVNQAAPEHVQIACAEAETVAAGVRHAGAIFLGAHAPEALGDYVAGPSHVLPTNRAARYASGVMAATFMKRTSLIGAGPAGLAALSAAGARLADAEGLLAHAASLRVRAP